MSVKVKSEANTVEEALTKAAHELGVDAADLKHRVLETKQDFWGGDGQTVVIEAWQRPAEPEPQGAPEAVVEAGTADSVDDAAEQEAPAEPGAEQEPVAAAAAEAAPTPTDDKPEVVAPVEAPAAKSAETAEVASAPKAAPRRESESEPSTADDGEGVDPAEITAFIAQIFHDMEFSCSAEIVADGDGYLAKVSGEDKDALLEGNGRCLSALELLANNAFRHKLPRGNKITVDSGDFRSRRDDELGDLALQVAHSAKESGRTQETQPLNPYERRLVHLALADHAGVTTKSRGTGFLKNVQVIPEGGRSGGRRGPRR